MRKLILLLLVMLAVRMAGRAVRRNAEVMAALWLLLGMTATVSTAGTAKSRSTEDRLNSLIPSVFPNTGGTVNGSMTVTGNHQVGGQLLGPSGSGSTLTVGSPTHFSGVAMTVDNGLTSHSNVAADGNVTAGGNMSVAGNHSVGGQMLVNASSSGATLAVGGNAHITSSAQVDGNVTAGGQLLAGGASSSATFAVAGNGHITGALQVDGGITGASLVTGGHSVSGWPISGGSIGTVNGTGASVTIAGGFQNALNSIYNALVSSGLA